MAQRLEALLRRWATADTLAVADEKDVAGAIRGSSSVSPKAADGWGSSMSSGSSPVEPSSSSSPWPPFSSSSSSSLSFFFLAPNKYPVRFRRRHSSSTSLLLTTNRTDRGSPAAGSSEWQLTAD
ncbi:hypothetical protein TTRE_0000199201 [Trichuris trichiura]|uniref:Uncharacterized protein n=1 Tax=Trichuris trichiura TaxID=36087 RepID=A0A077YZZ4_TRITR|nr:hypothetical protein TTRE_0000199201 [Trichuris trichiura]